MPKPITRANPKPVIDADGEARALTASEVARFRPAEDVLPETLLVKLNARGAQNAPVKERMTIRLSPEVVQGFRETSDGWQTRVDAALKDWLKSHKAASV